MATRLPKRTRECNEDGTDLELARFAEKAVGVIETGVALIRKSYKPNTYNNGKEKRNGDQPIENPDLDSYDGDVVVDVTMVALRNAVDAARRALIELFPKIGEQIADDAGWKERFDFGQ